MPISVENEESKGYDQTDYSHLNNDFDNADSDDDAKGKVIQGQLDRLQDLLEQKKTQKKQLEKSAAKDKARREKHIKMMQSMQQYHIDLAKEEAELARIRAHIRQAEEEDYMDALAKSSMLNQQ